MDIKELRMKLGWSREKMAAELGVSFGTIRNWESGKNNPSRLAEEKIKDLIKEKENG